MGLWSQAKIAAFISQFLQRKRLGDACQRDSASVRDSNELVVSLSSRVFKLKGRTVAVLEQRVKRYQRFCVGDTL